MEKYTLTVFSKAGETLLDESFDAASEKEAKDTGEKRLAELGYLDSTHRCTNSRGKLVLFHR
ncbi:YhzD family protein [Sutcliffiella deserti]|uniref:YhzD family protein n=1 Tax=Sutcliffiella deserti TaxID=2875501 RepID=UPI001CBFCCA4|nr:YhzD family protein [Sutcliffiella deserti]